MLKENRNSFNLEQEARNELINESENGYFCKRLEDWNKRLDIDCTRFNSLEKRKRGEKKQNDEKKQTNRSLKKWTKRSRKKRDSIAENRRKEWVLRIKSASTRHRSQKKKIFDEKNGFALISEKKFYKDLLDSYKRKDKTNLYSNSREFFDNMKYTEDKNYKGFYQKQKLKRITQNKLRHKKNLGKFALKEKQQKTSHFVKNFQFESDYFNAEKNQRRKNKLKNSSYYLNKKRALLSLKKNFKRQNPRIVFKNLSRDSITSNNHSRVKSKRKKICPKEQEIIFSINNKLLSTKIDIPPNKRKSMIGVSSGYLYVKPRLHSYSVYHKRRKDWNLRKQNFLRRPDILAAKKLTLSKSLSLYGDLQNGEKK